MDPVTIDIYDIAENEKGELLIALPDLEVDTNEAFFSVEGDVLQLAYPDGRAVRLPELADAVIPVLKAARKILVVESAPDRLVRAYDATAREPVLPQRRSRPPFRH